MVGASAEHNIIAGNLFAAMRAHLRGRGCQVFIADVKVQLQIAGSNVFYCPDVMVTCDPRDTDRFFKRSPRVLIEVLSPETERTDRREKYLSYIQIESLEECVLVAQDQSEIIVFRRSSHWHPKVINRPDDQLHLASIELTLPLAAIYEGVKP
jgi:Uma2 family endonuclease